LAPSTAVESKLDSHHKRAPLIIPPALGQVMPFDLSSTATSMPTSGQLVAMTASHSSSPSSVPAPLNLNPHLLALSHHSFSHHSTSMTPSTFNSDPFSRLFGSPESQRHSRHSLQSSNEEDEDEDHPVVVDEDDESKVEVRKIHKLTFSAEHRTALAAGGSKLWRPY